MTCALHGSGSVFAFLAILFIQIPATIYSGNEAEFSWPFRDILGQYAPWAIGIVVLAALLLFALPHRLARGLSMLFFVLTIIAWLNGTFFTYNFGLLDGHAWKIESPLWRICLELAAAGLAAAMAVGVLNKRPHAAAVLLGAISASACLPLTGIDWNKKRPAPADLSEFARFSAEKNVLVILLDSMQTDVLEDALSENKDILSALTGFTLFTDTAGVALTTFMTVPAIHSGTEYEPGQSIRKWYADGIKTGSFLNHLARAGYKSSMTNPVNKICPEKVHTCTPANWIFGGPETGLRDEAAKLANMGLLRMAPFPLKSTIYNRDNWVLSFSSFDPRLVHFVVEGNSFLREIAGTLSLQSTAPTAKFFHLFNTHLPVVLDKDCNFVGEIGNTRSGQVNQAKCAMRAVVELLKSLKEMGIYDKTAVILLADHGSGGWGNPRSIESRTLAAWLRAVANPALAIKSFNSEGPLTFSAKPLSISAVAPTVCHMTGDCEMDIGKSALAGSEGIATVRRFNTYSWKHEYWYEDTLPDLTTYEITGPVQSAESWKKLPPSKLPSGAP